MLRGKFDVGQATDVGRVREANEDALLAVPASSDAAGQYPLLVAVADGMGGHNAGEVASAIAVEWLAQAVGRFEAEDASTFHQLLEQAVLDANRAIWEAASGDAEKEGMGTTLVCAVVDASGAVVIANVGDSRAYVVSRDTARLVTMDHTWVAEQVQVGSLSEREANNSPYRHLLTRSLGSMPNVDVDMYTGLRLGPGDVLVLCSDGVTAYLGAPDLPDLVGGAPSAQAAAERLVETAVQRGGADNATAVVVRAQEL